MRFALVLLGLCACNPFKEGSMTGHVEGKGEVGTWMLESGNCYSGQREQYFGVIGYGPDGSGIAIKLVKDQIRGWTAIVNHADACKTEVEKGGCRATVFAPNDCTKLDIDLKNTSTTVNDIRAVDATLTIDCSNDKSTVKGTLTFDRCH
jgi:hypothetical protein